MVGQRLFNLPRSAERWLRNFSPSPHKCVATRTPNRFGYRYPKVPTGYETKVGNPKMSRKSQQNRASRKRKQQERDRSRSGRHDNSGAEINAVFPAAVEFAYGPAANPQSLRLAAEKLPAFEIAPPSAPLMTLLEPMFDTLIDHVFEAGWQPAELTHATRQEIGTHPTRLLLELIASHASRHSARSTAPQSWCDQLAELAIVDGKAATSQRLIRWRAGWDGDDIEVWISLVTLMAYLQYMGPLSPLMEVPSSWGSKRGSTPVTAQTESKMLAKIRGLLAKAEATTFAEEAEALSAKAQELMTRYAIDSAVLDSEAHTSLADEVVTRRIRIDNPYPESKVQLMQSVAESNNARVLWHKSHGLVSIVGMPIDLDLCELLFTSLLVQASHALTKAGSDRTTRSPSFRRSFLLAFATRIGQRLAHTRAHARDAASSQYGKELVPILAERDEAVEAAFEKQFPSITKFEHSAGNRAGWHAGSTAAETADLTGGRDRLDHSAH